MTEEEIKALALELGLDPKRLFIFEPVYRRSPIFDYRQYRLEYRLDDAYHDFSFAISRDIIDVGAEVEHIVLWVNRGLLALARKVGTIDNSRPFDA